MDLYLHKLKNIFKEIYGDDNKIIEMQNVRYENLVSQFNEKFNEADLHFFSTPGRTEISGNHTDHNHGRVMAAGINLDSIAVASKNNEKKVVMYSEGYDQPFTVDLNLLEIQDTDIGTTSGLIRGIAAGFRKDGYVIGGFNACIASNVLPGSGLSSSASIEVLIGTIFSTLFNENLIPKETLAQIGQYAENEYFGKPCGLMDQMACAFGGIISIDFKNPENPLIKKIEFDFDKQEYSLLVVDTGGNHADLTEDYAAIPLEMKSVAEGFGGKVCREISLEKLIPKIQNLRKKLGDRAVLRAIHFLRENERVVHQIDALEKGAFNYFLRLVEESGNSSFKWLQNIYTTKNAKEQGMTLALALTEKYISESGEGACRVHGGGFAGTIQVFLPNKSVDKYIALMDTVLGENKVLVLQIRPHGTLYLNDFICKD